MNIYSIPDAYGFWDLAGRNLFFKFPKFSFIDIGDEGNLDTHYFAISNLNLENPLAEALKFQKTKIYIKIGDNDTKDILNKIVRILPFCLLNKGRYVDGVVKLIDEIIIGVKENPELHKKILLEKLKSDRALSNFSQKRINKNKIVYEFGTRREHTELDGVLDEIILEKYYEAHSEEKTPEKDKEILEKSYIMSLSKRDKN